MSPRKVDHIIFDLDGLLINSEHICTIVASNILANYGKEFTRDIKSCIMGRPIREATVYLLSLFPDLPLTVDAYITHYDAGLACLLPTVTPLPGACRLIQHFGVPMAIATGCRRKNYDLKTQHLADLFACFGDRVVCGDDLRDGMRGKPTPNIFLMAAREKLGLDVGGVQGAPTEAEREVRGRGLVFEDGIPGVQGAKRAGMSVVWVPDGDLAATEYSGSEEPDLIIKSLEEFVPEEWGLPPYTGNTV